MPLKRNELKKNKKFKNLITFGYYSTYVESKILKRPNWLINFF